MRKSIFIIICILFSQKLISQTHVVSLQELENKLHAVLTDLRKSRDDATIIKINEQFKRDFEEALNLEGAFDYPFSSLTTVGKIYSKDKLVRVISWNVQYEDLSHDYYSFVMKKDDRRDRVSVTELKRQKQNLYAIQHDEIEAENWYGALYYDIIDVQRRNRTYYTLLGYDANNERSSIKLIDVLSFIGSRPRLGAPIFEVNDNIAHRVIFEHSSDATMSLRYDNEREKIIFDHLSPESPTMKEFREFYVPDMSYDAYAWDGRRWLLIEDIIAVNKETSDRINLRAYDAELDTVVQIPAKSKWINPEDETAPVDGGRHRAITPEDVKNESASKKNNKKEKRSRANKRNKKSSGRSNIQLNNRR